MQRYIEDHQQVEMHRHFPIDIEHANQPRVWLNVRFHALSEKRFLFISQSINVLVINR